MVERRDRPIVPVLGKRKICFTTQRIDQCGLDVFGIEEPCVGEHLMHVGSMGTSFFVLKLSPGLLVQVSEVGFVLRVDNMNLSTTLEHYVREQVGQRASHRQWPSQGKCCFAQATDSNRRASHASPCPVLGLNVLFPQHFKG